MDTGIVNQTFTVGLRAIYSIVQVVFFSHREWLILIHIPEMMQLRAGVW